MQEVSKFDNVNEMWAEDGFINETEDVVRKEFEVHGYHDIECSLDIVSGHAQCFLSNLFVGTQDPHMLPECYGRRAFVMSTSSRCWPRESVRDAVVDVYHALRDCESGALRKQEIVDLVSCLGRKLQER